MDCPDTQTSERRGHHCFAGGPSFQNFSSNTHPRTERHHNNLSFAVELSDVLDISGNRDLGMGAELADRLRRRGTHDIEVCLGAFFQNQWENLATKVLHGIHIGFMSESTHIGESIVVSWAETVTGEIFGIYTGVDDREFFLFDVTSKVIAIFIRYTDNLVYFSAQFQLAVKSLEAVVQLPGFSERIRLELHQAVVGRVIDFDLGQKLGDVRNQIGILSHLRPLEMHQIKVLFSEYLFQFLPELGGVEFLKWFVGENGNWQISPAVDSFHSFALGKKQGLHVSFLLSFDKRDQAELMLFGYLMQQLKHPACAPVASQLRQVSTDNEDPQRESNGSIALGVKAVEIK